MIDAAEIDAPVDAAPMDDAPVDASIDAAPDAMAADCQTDPDTLHHDEDADGVWDACDPCPTIPTATADDDGDGIGNACDPHPTLADTRILFEGFGGGIPPMWTKLGTFDAITDAVTTANGVSMDSALLSPVMSPAKLHARTRVTPTAATSPAGSRGMGVYGVGSRTDASDGIACDLAYRAGTTDPIIVLVYLRTGSVIKLVDYAWEFDTSYALTLDRDGTQYTCTIEGPQGPPVSVSGSSTGALPDPAYIGLRAVGMDGRFLYLDAMTTN